MELEIFETLKNAYETSTQNFNHFKAALDRIAWEDTFFSDCEYYFCKSGFVFTTPSLDPFQISSNWTPSATFSDGSFISF